MITVRKLLASELSWANARYTEVNFVPSAEEDFVVVAELDGNKIGLGRVVLISEDAGELGGMYVLPDFRGMKVASSIVNFLIENSPRRNLYCIPFRHLQEFYESFGFVTLSDESDIPSAVNKKFLWCRNHYQDSVSLLMRSSK